MWFLFNRTSSSRHRWGTIFHRPPPSKVTDGGQSGQNSGAIINRNLHGQIDRTWKLELNCRVQCGDETAKHIAADTYLQGKCLHTVDTWLGYSSELVHCVRSLRLYEHLHINHTSSTDWPQHLSQQPAERGPVRQTHSSAMSPYTWAENSNVSNG